ncbi:Fatty acyl-CoA reductase [Ilyonectria robusta]
MSPHAPLALITGATQGIGRTVAQILASKHSYHAIIAARNPQDGEEVATDLREAGHKASVVQLDLSLPDSIQGTIASIEKEFGYLDVLVNNAGILLDHNPSLNTWDLFSKTFTTNIIGTATLTEGLLPLLRKAKAGPPRVVFVTSIMGSLERATDKTTPYYNIDYKAYDASKAAVNMLMINYVRELDGVGAKVNSVCPGLVKTALNNFSEYGHSTEIGAERIIEMATLDENGPTGTPRRNSERPQQPPRAMNIEHPLTPDTLSTVAWSANPCDPPIEQGGLVIDNSIGMLAPFNNLTEIRKLKGAVDVSDQPLNFVSRTAQNYPFDNTAFQQVAMMLRRQTFPPFIHPHWHKPCLPEKLASCMSIAQLFVARTPETRLFLWRIIEAEEQRFRDEVMGLSAREIQPAVQAMIIYMIMAIIDQDAETQERGARMLETVEALEADQRARFSARDFVGLWMATQRPNKPSQV